MGLVQDALVRMFEELCAVMDRDPWETSPEQLTGMIDREMQELRARYAEDHEKHGKSDTGALHVVSGGDLPTVIAPEDFGRSEARAAEGRSDAGIATPAPARSQSSCSDTDEDDTNADVYMYGFVNWFLHNREELCRILRGRGMTETDLYIRGVRKHPTNMMSALARPVDADEDARKDLMLLLNLSVGDDMSKDDVRDALDVLIRKHWGNR